jgi:ribonuclease R
VIFRSAAKLSYQQAQAAIDGQPDDKTGPILETDPQAALGGLQTMAKARDRRGPLDLDLPERKICSTSQGHGRRRPSCPSGSTRTG